MTPRVGLELTEDRIRAVTVSRWSRKPEQSFEIRWDPRAPADAVALLRDHLGDVSGIGLSIGLAHTHVKHVKLPPVAANERRGILTLEPDRFFAMDSSRIVVAAAEDSDLVFAADSARVESWIEAFESWSPVNVVEPAASSLARALGVGGVRSGTFEMPSAAGEKGIVEIADRHVKTARRIDETAENKTRPTPSIRGLEAASLPAYGAALGFDAPLSETLFPEAELRRVRRERRIRTIRAAVNLVLALAFAVAAVDRSRSRVLEQENQEIADLTSKAEGPAAMQARLAQLEIQASTASSANSGHADPVAVLAAIGRRLPPDAVVISVRADGDEWQIDGTTTHASSIVPALDADPSLENVRFLSASTRFNEGSRVHETFSVALHAIR